MGGWKLKNIDVSVAVTLFGNQIELIIVPFRWAAPACRWGISLGSGPRSLHIFAGPFHIWTMGDLSALIAFDITIGQNPFHGGPLTPKKEPQ